MNTNLPTLKWRKRLH